MPMPKNRSLYIENDITWVWDGARLVIHDTPDVADLPTLLGRIARTAQRCRQTEITVLIAGDVAKSIGFPDRAPRRDPEKHPVLDLARAQRWRVTKLSPWTSFRHTVEPVAIHIGFADWLSPRTFALMGGQSHGVAHHDGPGTLVYLLGRYQDLTGVAFRATPGVSASALLESIWEGARPPRGMPPGTPASPYWHPDWSLIEPARVHTTERPYSHWSPNRDGARHVACRDGCPGFNTDSDRWRSFDGFRNYLAAAATVETAFSELQPRPMSEFDRKMAGYWQVTMPLWNETRLPHPIASNVPPGEKVWVATPTLDLVRELSEMKDAPIEMPEVHRAYVAKRGTKERPYANTRRVLRTWAEQIDRSANAALEEHSPAEGRLLEDVIKAGYKEAFGMWLNDTGRVWRPDYSHTVASLARCNGFRKMWRAAMAGYWPVHIYVDEITYEIHDDTDFVPPGFRIAQTLGGFKKPRDNHGEVTP